MEPRFEALVNLFKDEEIAKKLMSLSPEEAVEYLREQHHLEFSVEELKDVGEGMKKAFEDDSDDELSETALEFVAGGGSTPYNVGYYIGKGVKVVGSVAGIVAAGISIFGW